MNKIKFYIRCTCLFFIRFFNSLFWYLSISMRNLNTNIQKKILDMFENPIQNINIICPGPSIKNIENKELNKNEIYIFINHAVAYASRKQFQGLNKIFFTTDPVRAKEVLDQRLDDFKNCQSILFPGHLFHMNHRLFRNFKIIYRPKHIYIDKNYGVVAKSIDLKKISAPDNTFASCGFGSLISAISFGLIFKPKKINFWGCDFGPVKDLEYGVGNIKSIGSTPYDKIRETINKIEQILINTEFKYN